MILAIDVGNTETSLATFRNIEDFEVIRTATSNFINREDLQLDLAEQYDRIIISSVVPNINSNLTDFLKSKYDAEILFLENHVEELGLSIKIDKPEQIGADRIANSYYAKQKYDKSVIIIDFGTVTTFDVIDDNGDYIGGIFFPGVKMSFDSLAAKTAKLPQLDFAIPKDLIGKNTEEAMRSGIFYGNLGMTNYICELLRERLNNNVEIIVTGGLGEIVVKELDIVKRFDPFLTLKGLYLASLNIK